MLQRAWQKYLELTAFCIVVRSRKETFLCAWAARCFILSVGACNKQIYWRSFIAIFFYSKLWGTLIFSKPNLMALNSILITHDLTEFIHNVLLRLHNGNHGDFIYYIYLHYGIIEIIRVTPDIEYFKQLRLKKSPLKTSILIYTFQPVCFYFLNC